MDVFLPDDDWNDHHASPGAYVQEQGLGEGAEFELVRATVAAKTRYRVVNGEPVVISVAFGAELRDAGSER